MSALLGNELAIARRDRKMRPLRRPNFKPLYQFWCTQEEDHVKKKGKIGSSFDDFLKEEGV